MTIDIEKAKQVLAALQREKLEQEERLQRAREDKNRLEAMNNPLALNH